MKKVVFYNHFKNGDIHLSRGFVRHMMSKLKSENLNFFYYHRNSPELLQDISGLAHTANEVGVPSHLSGHVKKEDTLYVNTWYGCDNYKYMNRYGLSFDALFANFSEACKLGFGFELDQLDYLEFFPTIDFDKFQIEEAKNFVKKAEATSNKLILVANGHVKSGQAINFNLSSVIANLANKYQGLIFMLTDKSEGVVQAHNIFYTSDIIRKSGNDLNENAWLGTKSDFIVGRASGVFSFCVTKEIVFNNPNTSFVSFSDLDLKKDGFWLGEIFRNKIKYASSMCNYNYRTSVEATNLLSGLLQAKYG